MAISLATRTMTEIVKGNVRNPKRVITGIVQISLEDALHGTKTTMAHTSMALMANMRDHMCMIAHLTAAKQSRDAKWVPVRHAWLHRKSRTSERQPLLPLPMFHSTPIAAPHRLSSDPTSAHLSFDQSRGSLPPIDLGGSKPRPISSASVPIQVGVSSVPGPLPLPSESVSALRLAVDHTKEIFNLACEGHQLKERVAWEFAKLSNQEVLFRTQAQSTSYEMLASGCPDCFPAYYAILRSDQETLEAKDKAIEELLNKVSNAWLRANARHYSSMCWITKRSWTHS